ncbi:hypothetical protein LOTGIDRAFT_229223 [Lottia gigantea]|uniref:VWFA domain-containing protein n=1 Tax=Lottia gigantea TaxID=225164 RepID=V4BL99_LOTGI|nr:hypothetical protein LOTGIDRAFT_229223 [Lottia gigantea]ESO89374.1 hypothetical protein LOTGIDRAFT_229223 [Lottia gigantea]
MRGRGRGRGRGARGGRRRGGGRGGARRNIHSDNNDRQTAQATIYNVETEPKQFFIANASFDDHLTAQKTNRDRYAAALATLQATSIVVTQNAKIRALAAAWARNDYDLAKAFLFDREQMGLVEVLKAVTLLDSGRQIRVLEKRVKRIELSGTKVKGQKMGILKRDIDNLKAIKPSVGTASGALCKHISQWVKTFTTEELQFYALHLPKDPWKKLADICHFHPTKDFEALPWFLPFCFGESAPEDSLVRRCRDVTADNVNDLVAEFDVPYSHIKTFKDKLTEKSKARIASYEPKIDTVLWWYEDLICDEVDVIIQQRIQASEEINLPNGKLLERLLTFKIIRENLQTTRRRYGQPPAPNTEANKARFLKDLIPIGERKLTSIRLPLEAPIIVIGDASGSMEIAIKTSTIIAGLLTAITSAKLVFFNTANRDAPYMPETIEQVLQLAVETVAGGGTTPAASLLPFYEKKEAIKTFIMVTDEEENGKANNMNFCELYTKYYKEVYPAKLVFVSFLRGQHAKGQMVTQLQTAGFDPLQFKLDGTRPDLTKLDNLFGLLSSDSQTFSDDLTTFEQKIQAEGVQKVFEFIKNKLN